MARKTKAEQEEKQVEDAEQLVEQVEEVGEYVLQGTVYSKKTVNLAGGGGKALVLMDVRTGIAGVGLVANVPGDFAKSAKVEVCVRLVEK